MTYPLYMSASLTDGRSVYTVLDTVNEVELNDLNYSGLGKNFGSGGTISLSFSWTYDQNYNDIKGKL